MENEIAVRLKAFRLSLGLTQGEFGDKCGISQRTYANLENGKTKKVSSACLSQIESAYPQLNPTWLRHGAGEMLRHERPKVPTHFEEASPAARATTMSIAHDPDEKTLAEQLAYWKARAEIAEAELAEIQAVKRHEGAVRLVSAAGGRSGFNDASADAADEDYTPPVMTAETIRRDAPAPMEAEPIKIRRWGNLASLS